MSRGTLDTVRSFRFSLTGLSPSLAGFPKTVLLTFQSLVTVLNPEMLASPFRLLPFRSPLLWKSMFLSLPPGT